MAKSTRSSGAEPTRRLVTLMSLLTSAGAAGMDAGDLADALGFTAKTDQDRRDQVAREVRHLLSLGHRIVNNADAGGTSRWVLHPGDDRVRLELTPEQRHELRRAAILIGDARVGDRLESPQDSTGDPLEGMIVIEHQPPPVILDSLLRAVGSRAVVSFEYAGKDRRVDPIGVRPAPRGWVLIGHEAATAKTKTFSLNKMVDLRIGQPGSASPPAGQAPVSMDPLSWSQDEPAAAVLEVSNRFVADVRRLLHEPISVRPLAGRVAVPGDPTHEPLSEMTYRVTNRRAFLARLFELGERVVLAGDDVMRAAAAQALQKVIDA